MGTRWRGRCGGRFGRLGQQERNAGRISYARCGPDGDCVRVVDASMPFVVVDRVDQQRATIGAEQDQRGRRGGAVRGMPGGRRSGLVVAHERRPQPAMGP